MNRGFREGKIHVLIMVKTHRITPRQDHWKLKRVEPHQFTSALEVSV